MCVMALGVIGGVLGAVGSVVGGMMAAQQANMQAQAYQRQAAAERQQAAFNAEQQEHKAIALISKQRASMLAAGVSLEGTPMAVIDDTTKQTDLDVQAIKYNGEIKASNFETQAAIFRSKASSAAVGGLFGAISPIVKGFGSGGGADFSFGGSTSVADDSDYG